MKLYTVELDVVIPGGFPLHPWPPSNPAANILASPSFGSFLHLTGHQRVATHSPPVNYVSMNASMPSSSYGVADECTFTGRVEAETPGEAVIFALCDLDAQELSPDRATVSVDRLA